MYIYTRRARARIVKIFVNVMRRITEISYFQVSLENNACANSVYKQCEPGVLFLRPSPQMPGYEATASLNKEVGNKYALFAIREFWVFKARAQGATFDSSANISNLKRWTRTALFFLHFYPVPYTVKSMRKCTGNRRLPLSAIYLGGR